MSDTINRLLKKKVDSCQRITVESAESFYNISDIRDCNHTQSSPKKVSGVEAFKLDVLKHYIEEASIIICILEEGALKQDELVQRANLLALYRDEIEENASLNRFQFRILLGWFDRNDGREEVTALVYFAATYAKSDLLLLNSIMEELEKALPCIRQSFIQALKWVDNHRIDCALRHLMHASDDDLLKQELEQLLRLRHTGGRLVTIPFLQSFD